MNQRATTSLCSGLVAAAMLLAAALPVAAADRAGGLRQEPLSVPPSVKRPTTTVTPQADDAAQPQESALITYRGARYVVSDGRWYRQKGDKLEAVPQPEGVLVPALPSGYSMKWVGGVPYFHAKGIYYVWRERKRSYEIVPAP
jgi:hypothetical protein